MPYSKSNKEIQEARMGGVGKYKSPNTYAPFKMKAAAHNNSPMQKNFGVGSTEKQGGVGSEMEPPLKSKSSPAKGLWGNLKSKAQKMLGIDKDGAARKVVEQGGIAQSQDPVLGGDAPAVQPHGEEAHTGGAIGGEPQGEAFSAMGSEEFKGMDQTARTDYMKGLSPEDRKTQTRSMIGGAVGGFGGMLSDIRLKENITNTGKSPSGIPIYEFNYIGDNTRYSGAMAQDLLGTNAVSTHESGFYMVDYNSIDVDMKLI